jgi:hypothetical protein
MKAQAPPIGSVELFDFARIIGAHICGSFSYSPDNTYANAYLKLGYHDIGPRSLFGRSDKADLDEALADLVAGLVDRGQISFMDDKRTTFHVPPLKHTPGYRGKKIKKKPVMRATA